MSEPRYLVFDTETTGIDVFNDRIVQLVIATADEYGELIDKWEWIIDPGVDVPEGAAEVHGLTTEFLRDKGQKPRGALEEAWGAFMGQSDLIWVAFNLNFDLSILDAEFDRHKVDYEFADNARKNIALFDPLVVDRRKDKWRKGKRTLEMMAPVYKIEFDADLAHEAGYDVEITARVAARIAMTYGVPSTKQQSSWYAEWAEGLEAYFRRTDPDAVVDRGWPLKTGEN